jgi:hypothetical protein
MKFSKILLKVLSGSSDANINFDDLCYLLEYLGFTRRVKGSHNIFKKLGIETKINLQKDGSKAKHYQVNQIRKLLTENKLLENIDV